jgi:hypothetical protein
MEITDVIDYPPERLLTFRCYSYEWIDVLAFQRKPSEFIAPELLPAYLHLAGEIFKAAGWEGTGEIQLIWIPPFVFNPTHYQHTRGVCCGT